MNMFSKTTAIIGLPIVLPFMVFVGLLFIIYSSLASAIELLTGEEL